MTTVRDLIGSSLRLISVLGAGENMTAEDANDGLSTLNQMLASWSADGQVIYSRSVDTKVLTAGVSTLTMGAGGDINTSRPASITNATVTLGSVVYPGINIWNESAYSTLTFPSQQGIPSELYVNNGSPLVTLQLYPVPIGGLTLTIYSMKTLASLGLNDVLDLPPGYEMALRFNLAVLLAPEYDREPRQTVSDMAKESKGVIMRNNQQYSPPISAVDPALDQRYTNAGIFGFNIYGGF